MVFHTVYKTINSINGKFYIGVHQTENPNDEYLGSGKLIVNAIKKYGRENFTKEVLFIFDNSEEAYYKEKELVNDEIISSGLCYNLVSGGNGGIGPASAYIKRVKEDLEFAKSLSLRLKKLRSDGVICAPNWTGRNHREETKEKIGLANSVHQSGPGNSQFGTMWITDGILNKKIKKDQEIPEGWRSGRIC